MTPDWTGAACREVDAEIFYPPGRHTKASTAAAKAVCGTCPILADCRAYALTTVQEWGVWGGLDETERRSLTNVPAPLQAAARSRRARSERLKAQAVQLAARGVTAAEIAARIGRAPDTVTRYIRDAERRAS